MWPKVAWWIVGTAAFPVAKYMLDKILEHPSYQAEIAKINETKHRKEILFRKFSNIT